MTVAAVTGWKVKENSEVLARETQHSNDIDDDSDIECMFPAPDEGSFCYLLIAFNVAGEPSMFKL